MKLDFSLNTETNCTLKETNFNINASPIAFDILSNKLYSNPILAIVRELLCNAYDSHVVANTTDIPIDIIFPDNLENSFTIRDYGTGLSEEDIYRLYTTFFGSNKSKSNDLTGGFGLGSKTPFAYTSSFSVTSYYNGIEYRYLVTKKDGYPIIYKISSNPTTEHNGLKVSIPVSKDDNNYLKFFNEFQNYIKYIPEIKVKSNKVYKQNIPIYKNNNITFYKNINNYYNYDYIYIKQGQNVYKININNYNLIVSNVILDIFGCIDIVIEVPIGTVGITPNREQLSTDNKNYDLIKELLNNNFKIIESDIYNIIKVFKNTPSISFNNLVVNYYNKYLKDVDLHLSTYRNISLSFPFPYYFNNISVNNRYNRDSYIKEYDENIILYLSNKNYNSNIRKLNNILRNYEKELNNKKILLFNIDDITETRKNYNKNISELDTIRILYNYVWYANNIPDFNFNITCMSISKFFRKYPNYKTKRNKKSTINKEDIFININNICLTKDSIIQTYSNSFSVKYIEDNIINKYNTILVFNDNGSSISYNEPNIIFRTLKTLSSYNNQYNKIINYFKDNYNMDCTEKEIYLAFICKSNKKYFKQCPIITISQLKELARTFDCVVFDIYNDKTVFRRVCISYEEILNKIDKYILKDKNIWLNSSFIKKLKLLNSIYNKYMNKYIIDNINEIKYFIGENNVKYKKIPKILIVILAKLIPTYDKFYYLDSYRKYKRNRNDYLNLLRSNYAVF